MVADTTVADDFNEPNIAQQIRDVLRKLNNVTDLNAIANELNKNNPEVNVSPEDIENAINNDDTLKAMFESRAPDREHSVSGELAAQATDLGGTTPDRTNEIDAFEIDALVTAQLFQNAQETLTNAENNVADNSVVKNISDEDLPTLNEAIETIRNSKPAKITNEDIAAELNTNYNDSLAKGGKEKITAEDIELADARQNLLDLEQKYGAPEKADQAKETEASKPKSLAEKYQNVLDGKTAGEDAGKVDLDATDDRGKIAKEALDEQAKLKAEQQKLNEEARARSEKLANAQNERGEAQKTSSKASRQNQPKADFDDVQSSLGKSFRNLAVAAIAVTAFVIAAPALGTAAFVAAAAATTVVAGYTGLKGASNLASAVGETVQATKGWGASTVSTVRGTAHSANESLGKSFAEANKSLAKAGVWKDNEAALAQAGAKLDKIGLKEEFRDLEKARVEALKIGDNKGAAALKETMNDYREIRNEMRKDPNIENLSVADVQEEMMKRGTPEQQETYQAAYASKAEQGGKSTAQVDRDLIKDLGKNLENIKTSDLRDMGATPAEMAAANKGAGKAR